MAQKRIDTISALLTCLGVLFLFLTVQAQLPNFTVDEDFDTQALFRDGSGVSDLYILEDGRILVGGGFDNDWNGSPYRGYGMIMPEGNVDMSWPNTDAPSIIGIISQDNGFVFPTIQSLAKITLEGNPWFQEFGHYWCEYIQGGIFSPYNVESVWTIYQQDDGKLLIGGAIATDTLQPSLFRCISRLNADGTHDPTFPILEPIPNNSNAAVMKIHKASNGYWYVSGPFQGINGHETNHIARLTPDFEVDTSFVSPMMYYGILAFNTNIRYVDSQDRLWVSGDIMRLQENPQDTIQFIRLMSDGSVDESFMPRYLDKDYPEEWTPKPLLISGVKELESNPGDYLVYGQFESIDGVTENSITVMDDNGNIQDHYFQGQGATENIWGYVPLHIPNEPGIQKVVELENGDLLVGGTFSEFMGTTHYNMVKLNLGVIISVEQTELDRKFRVYPNPSSDYLNISFEGLQSGTIRIMNLSGQNLETYQMKGETLRLDVSVLAKGLYFISLETEGGTAVKKIVIH